MSFTVRKVVPALLFCKHRARLWTLMDDNVAPAFPRDIATERQGTHDLVARWVLRQKLAEVLLGTRREAP